MALVITDGGSRNRVDVAPDVRENGVGQIILTGDDNHVTLGTGALLNGVRIELGSRCAFTAAPHCNLANIMVFGKTDARASVGSFTAFTGWAGLWLHEPAAITIGEHCIIGLNTVLTVSDMHPIFDRRSGKRLNAARDVTVEDEVWLGTDVVLLKGAHVRRGSIIGWRSLVTGQIPAHCAAAGSPARVVRKNVSWKE